MYAQNAMKPATAVAYSEKPRYAAIEHDGSSGPGSVDTCQQSTAE